jgi:orotate phosphoribosyltransferase
MSECSLSGFRTPHPGILLISVPESHLKIDIGAIRPYPVARGLACPFGYLAVLKMNSLGHDSVFRLLRESQAIRTGHFELSSGLHSDTYIQCALVLQHPPHAESLGRELAGKLAHLEISCVVSPALGGIIIGHEVARALGTRAIFAERDLARVMTLRRGFSLSPGERVLVVEDVWTTGGSTRETMHVVSSAGGLVVAAAAVIDRSGAALDLGVPAESLLRMSVASWPAEDCPLCRQGIPAVKPGSRYSPPAR